MGNEANSEAQSETQSATDPKVETTTTEPSETPGTTTEAASSDDVHKELDALKAALKKANAEAAKHRHAATELDRLKAEADAAKLSETEKLQKQLAALQRERDEAVTAHQEGRISSAIQVQALRQGIDPALANKLIDRTDITFGDDGAPTNVESLLKSLTKQYPGLVAKQAAASTSGGATNPARSQSDNGEITASYVNDVTSGKIPWQSLTPERRTAILNWQAKNPFRF